MGRIQEKVLDVDLILLDLLMAGPLAWALIRVQEVYFLASMPFTSPVLDLACGDGSFAGILLKHQALPAYDVGTDIDRRELEKARKSGSYKSVILADASRLPFKNGEFNTIFSNGSVEHFENFELCLSEIRRVLTKNGVCYLTVPGKEIGKYLFFSKVFRFLRLGIFADAYEVFFNTLFKHRNLYSHTEWKKFLQKNKLTLDNYFYYNFDPVIPGHDILLWLNSWNFVVKKITGNWFSSMKLRRLIAPIEKKNC